MRRFIEARTYLHNRVLSAQTASLLINSNSAFRTWSTSALRTYRDRCVRSSGMYSVQDTDTIGPVCKQCSFLSLDLRLSLKLHGVSRSIKRIPDRRTKISEPAQSANLSDSKYQPANNMLSLRNTAFVGALGLTLLTGQLGLLANCLTDCNMRAPVNTGMLSSSIPPRAGTCCGLCEDRAVPCKELSGRSLDPNYDVAYCLHCPASRSITQVRRFNLSLQAELARCLTDSQCQQNLICLQNCNGREDESQCQVL